MSVSKPVDWIVNGLFAVSFALVWLKTAFPIQALEKSPWLEALLLVAATAFVVISHSRTLPLQNVLWGALVIGCAGGTAHAIGTLASIPFGPFVYTDAVGPRLFETLPWAVPLIWVLLIYTSRGVARLILKPWRKNRVYGFWVIGVTAMLSLLLDMGLDPWASWVKHYWMWEPTRLPFDWDGTPLTNFAGWIVTALLILAFVTPMLIRKKPGDSAPEYRPLIVWNLLNLLFATAGFAHQHWLSAITSIMAAAGISIVAIRGGRW